MIRISLKENIKLQTVNKVTMSHLQLIDFLINKVGQDMTRLICYYNWSHTTKTLVNDQVKYLSNEHMYLLRASTKAAIERTMWAPVAPPLYFFKYALYKINDKTDANSYNGKDY